MKTRCTCNGIEYESTEDACEAHGLDANSVRRRKSAMKSNRVACWETGGRHKAGAVAPYVFEWPEEGKDA